ncbi:hypothetical protein LO763_22595 [Glycomyces sp. A-F 0318]|uniref:hypothetical protein n=1 Tax=Glycomyces amatae TaxID=2881355 RepID=UPI001E4AC3B8|nr:hypothetical protein [Glycomyces amatae]MCD0446409.1 hypothetical protein [Glycomyces amatae]
MTASVTTAHAILVGHTTRRAIELDAALVSLYRQGHTWGETCVNDAADRFRDTRMNLAALAGHDRLRRAWREDIRTLALRHHCGVLTTSEIAALAVNMLHPGPPGRLVRKRGMVGFHIEHDFDYLMTRALTSGAIVHALNAAPR